MRRTLIPALIAVFGGAIVFGQQTDPVIERARAAAAEYAQSLPNYVARRTTTRYRSVVCTAMTAQLQLRQALADITFDWKVQDSVSSDVVSEHAKEVYSNILVDGKPARELPRRGVWSAGEFASLLTEILSPKHAAVFTGQRVVSMAGRPSWRDNFVIDKEYSGWDLDSVIPGSGKPIRVSPGYSGVIWIDQATGKVVRIEKSAKSIPLPFPLERVDAATDYTFVEIGKENYLLPSRSETILCTRIPSSCYRNETVFRNYSKFEASTTISFDK